MKRTILNLKHQRVTLADHLGLRAKHTIVGILTEFTSPLGSLFTTEEHITNPKTTKHIANKIHDLTRSHSL